MTNAQQQKLRATLDKQTTAGLCTCFELLNAGAETAQKAMVRGWIMDELERRDPDGFYRWIDDMTPENMYKPGLFFA